MRRHLPLMLFLCAATVLAAPAFAGDYRIVPGQRIGSVALGMSRQAIHQALHLPRMTRRLHDGTIEESWITRLSKAQLHPYRQDGHYWRDYFVNVYFRQDRVAQVEVNSPIFKTANGLSTNSNASTLERQYRPYRSSGSKDGQPLWYGHRDPGGYPGFKHPVTIEDAAQAGIAWRYGSYGDLGPEPDPDVQEVIIVHPRGQHIIREPDAGDRFVLTSHDVGLRDSDH